MFASFAGCNFPNSRTTQTDRRNEGRRVFWLGIIALVLAAVGAILWAVLAFKGTEEE